VIVAVSKQITAAHRRRRGITSGGVTGLQTDDSGESDHDSDAALDGAAVDGNSVPICRARHPKKGPFDFEQVLRCYNLLV
jgi:hypothetical protein